MGADAKPDYSPQKAAETYCPGAIQDCIGSYKCGILKGRACNGKIHGNAGGKKYKCKTAGFDIELREPPVL
jgi:hypothetical protein